MKVLKILEDAEVVLADKGYGFIENDAGGKDVFLHVSALEQAGIDTLEEGEAVSFEIGDNRGKENAINITKI